MLVGRDDEAGDSLSLVSNLRSDGNREDVDMRDELGGAGWSSEVELGSLLDLLPSREINPLAIVERGREEVEDVSGQRQAGIHALERGTDA